MENSFTKTSATSLSLGSLLSLVTMLLHPSGGSIEHIIRMRHILIFSHVLAIACLPLLGFGAWGLSILLQTRSRISTLIFFVFCFGLIAAMIAAAVNGLILPQFLSASSKAASQQLMLRTVVNYGHHMNISLANIFIFASSLSIMAWCILIIRSGLLPRWTGHFGLLLFGFGIGCFLLKVNFTALYGFRIFVAGLAIWMIIAGLQMILTVKSNIKK
ncbi:hypothetical protein [Dyadobacter psychrotolerans]|uniref:DUF4386 domain-containing protein n=1 Tax=Dyadobacter psychrotolerans TaxID=2541721 RepID=A0A4R5DCQ1_9BACT|nr:hypothetical protein [Dyadobacter psychrotolerans]TDE09601.1 hypothetical protein E0F88_30405 [Dyadobacter psychrotolerans]